jgi:hypothetical protein
MTCEPWAYDFQPFAHVSKSVCDRVAHSVSFWKKSFAVYSEKTTGEEWSRVISTQFDKSKGDATIPCHVGLNRLKPFSYQFTAKSLDGAEGTFNVCSMPNRDCVFYAIMALTKDKTGF